MQPGKADSAPSSQSCLSSEIQYPQRCPPGRTAFILTAALPVGTPGPRNNTLLVVVKLMIPKEAKGREDGEEP